MHKYRTYHVPWESWLGTKITSVKKQKRGGECVWFTTYDSFLFLHLLTTGHPSGSLISL